jgi:hypothetical protein
MGKGFNIVALNFGTKWGQTDAKNVGFEALTAKKRTIFWDAMKYSSVGIYQCFERGNFPHLQASNHQEEENYQRYPD